MKNILVVLAVIFTAAASRADLGNAPPRPEQPCFSPSFPAQPNGGNIVLPASIASRISGVAPLAVFFDVSGATTTDITPLNPNDRPFLDLAGCWDFGDPASGHFAATGVSKNQARGLVAGHVFETPGTYNVQVRVRDGQDQEATAGVEITVQDPEGAFTAPNGRTVCFSSSGDFAGCPSADAADRVTASTLAALQPYVAQGRRLLLRRGDSFTNDQRLTVNVPGPGMIGAYGNGARPRIAGDQTFFHISGRNFAFSDWRVMDLELDGLLTAGRQGVTVQGKADNLLLLRMGIFNTGTGVTAPVSVINAYLNDGVPGHDVIDVLAIQETEISRLSGGNLLYLGTHRAMLLGNHFHDSVGGEHVLRTPWLDRAVVSGNVLARSTPGKHLTQIHAPSFTITPEDFEPSIGNGRYTERAIFSDNLFDPGDDPDWSVYIGAQNQSSDEHLRDIIVERNLFLPGARARRSLRMASVAGGAVRDNAFNNGAGSACVELGDSGWTDLETSGVRLEHNTCTGSGASHTLVNLVGASGITAHNNLVIGSGTLRVASGSGLAEEGDNLLYASPAVAGLAGVPGQAWSDFRLAAGSPAIGAGDPARRTPWDFEGRSRDAAPDVGAFEFSSGPADSTPPARPRGLRVR